MAAGREWTSGQAELERKLGLLTSAIADNEGFEELAEEEALMEEERHRNAVVREMGCMLATGMYSIFHCTPCAMHHVHVFCAMHHGPTMCMLATGACTVLCHTPCALLCDCFVHDSATQLQCHFSIIQVTLCACCCQLTAVLAAPVTCFIRT